MFLSVEEHKVKCWGVNFEARIWRSLALKRSNISRAQRFLESETKMDLSSSPENTTPALPGNCVIRGCNSGKTARELFPAAHHRWAVLHWRDLPSCSSSLPLKLTGCSAGFSLFNSCLKEPGTKYKGCPRAVRSFAPRPTQSPLSERLLQAFLLGSFSLG